MAVTTTRPAPLPKFLVRPIVAIQQNFRRIVTSTIALIVILAVWQVLCAGEKPPLPPPTTVLQDTWELIVNPFFDNGGTDKGLFWHLLASLTRVAIGFSLSAIIGVAIGLVIGTNRLVYDAFDPIFQVLRTVPPLAWLPISLAVFRDNQPSAIFVIFITAVWPIVINTAVGAQQVPQDYRNVSRVLQLSRFEYFTNVLFPATVPYVFTGLRIALGLSWLAIVAAEMLIGGVGIGFFIWDAWNSSLMSEIILALIYVGIVGFLLDRLMAMISGLFLPEEQK